MMLGNTKGKVFKSSIINSEINPRLNKRAIMCPDFSLELNSLFHILVYWFSSSVLDLICPDLNFRICCATICAALMAILIPFPAKGWIMPALSPHISIWFSTGCFAENETWLIYNGFSNANSYVSNTSFKYLFWRNTFCWNSSMFLYCLNALNSAI